MGSGHIVVRLSWSTRLEKIKIMLLYSNVFPRPICPLPAVDRGYAGRCREKQARRYLSSTLLSRYKAPRFQHKLDQGHN